MSQYEERGQAKSLRALTPPQRVGDECEIKGEGRPSRPCASRTETVEEESTASVSEVLTPEATQRKMMGVADDRFWDEDRPPTAHRPAVAEFSVLAGCQGEAGMEAT